MAVSTPTPVALAARAAAPRFGDRAYWANIRYLVFGRAVPAILFGFMGWLQITRALSLLPAATTRVALLDVAPRMLYAAFCCIPVALYLARPKPQARDGRLVARAAAFSGTTMQLVVGAFVPSGALLLTVPDWVGAVGTVMVAGAWCFAIYGMAYLRRSLSIIPEARRLVTGGPYRLVRHPLYLAEISAAVAIVLGSPRLVPASALLVFVAMQVVRTHFEERLLADNFPEYRSYAARTHRLIPGVW